MYARFVYSSIRLPPLPSPPLSRFQHTHTLTPQHRLRVQFDKEEKEKYPVLAEDAFRTLNACMVTQNNRALDDCATQSLQSVLPSSKHYKEANVPVARIVRFSEPPKVVQYRVFGTNPSQDEVKAGQITLRLITWQSPVKKANGYPKKPLELPKGTLNILPAGTHGIFGKLYYYNEATRKSSWSLNTIQRFTKLPAYNPQRGTFGNTGRVIDYDAKEDLYEVENYLVLERMLHDPNCRWRVHHF